MHLTLQQMRLFEAVARHRSFTRAAEELCLTQPAVSIQIKRLEENAGLPLFEQVGRRIFLTAAGREMHAACRDVLARLSDLAGAIDDLQGRVRGPLHLSAVTTAKYFMPHLLGAFLHKHPEVEPRLIVTNRERVILRLSENQDDLVIMGQVPEQLGVQAHPFLENLLVVVAHPEHPLVGQRAIALERVCRERFLVRESGSGTRGAVDRLFAGRGLQVDPYMELGSSEAIKQAVMAGLGLSVLSLHSLRLELACAHVAVLDVEGFPLRRRWYAVHPRTKRLSLVARTFLGFILQEAEGILRAGPGATGPETHAGRPAATG